MAERANRANDSANTLDLRSGPDAPPLDAVLAHSMLGTIAAARAAIELALEADDDPLARERLLRIASGRLDLIAKQLHRVSSGFVAEAIALTLEHQRDVSPDR